MAYLDSTRGNTVSSEIDLSFSRTIYPVNLVPLDVYNARVDGSFSGPFGISVTFKFLESFNDRVVLNKNTNYVLKIVASNGQSSITKYLYLIGNILSDADPNSLSRPRVQLETDTYADFTGNIKLNFSGGVISNVLWDIQESPISDTKELTKILYPNYTTYDWYEQAREGEKASVAVNISGSGILAYESGVTKRIEFSGTVSLTSDVLSPIVSGHTTYSSLNAENAGGSASGAISKIYINGIVPYTADKIITFKGQTASNYAVSSSIPVSTGRSSSVKAACNARLVGSCDLQENIRAWKINYPDLLKVRIFGFDNFTSSELLDGKRTILSGIGYKEVDVNSGTFAASQDFKEYFYNLSITVDNQSITTEKSYTDIGQDITTRIMSDSLIKNGDADFTDEKVPVVPPSSNFIPFRGWRYNGVNLYQSSVYDLGVNQNYKYFYGTHFASVVGHTINQSDEYIDISNQMTNVNFPYSYFIITDGKVEETITISRISNNGLRIYFARRTSSILFTANAKIYKPGSDFGYGNMSGYRYLDLTVKSIDNKPYTSLVKILEQPSGEYKTWTITSSGNSIQKVRIDLCNPTNKNDKIDYQDSPYPRINLVSTSYIEDERKNGPYYGITRCSKLIVESDNIIVSKAELAINKFSKSNLIYSSYNHTEERATASIVAENIDTTEIPTVTRFYARRFWQQNSDGRDEEESDVEWNVTTAARVTFRTIQALTIQDFVNRITSKDYLFRNGKNEIDFVTRHPGWNSSTLQKKSTNCDVRYPLLRYCYLNDERKATYLYGGGIYCDYAPKSNTRYSYGFDLKNSANQNDTDVINNIPAQTLFHGIKARFIPDLLDPFDLEDVTPNDRTIFKLVLRGGSILRGPSHGLLGKPDGTPLITSTDLVQLLLSKDKSLRGESSSDAQGIYETGSQYGLGDRTHDNVFKTNLASILIYPSKRTRIVFRETINPSISSIVAAQSFKTKRIIVSLNTINADDRTKIDETVDILSTDNLKNLIYQYYTVVDNIGNKLKTTDPFVIASDAKTNEKESVSFILGTYDDKDNSDNNKVSIVGNNNFNDYYSWSNYLFGKFENGNFSSLPLLFEKSKLNSFCVSDGSPIISIAGYVKTNSIVVQTTEMTRSNNTAPSQMKTYLIHGTPESVKSFNNVVYPNNSSSGTANTSYPSVVHLNDRDLLVTYLKQEEPYKIFGRFIENEKVEDEFVVMDLPLLTNLSSETLKTNLQSSVDYINSTFDKRNKIYKLVFSLEKSLFYYEVSLTSLSNKKQISGKLHFVAGTYDSAKILFSSLRSQGNLFVENGVATNQDLGQQRAGIISLTNSEQDSQISIWYKDKDNYLNSILIVPYKFTFNPVVYKK